MPLDGLTLGFISRELKVLEGGRVDRISQPEKDMVVFSVRANSQNFKLLISASPSLTRFHLTEQSFQNPPDAPMFCMLLRKYLMGGRIMEITQLYGDRLVKIVIDNRDELGESGARELWFEAMGRHSNLTLVMNGRVVDAIRHISGDMSRVRQVLPGLPFDPPPRQEKLAPDEITANALLERLTAEQGRLQKALMNHISGLSPVSSRELTLRLSGLGDPLIADIDLNAVCAKAEAFFQRLDSMAPPVLLTDETDARIDFFPFAYFTFDAERQTPCKTLSEAMDRFYSGRDRVDRMAQRGAALKKMLRTHLERDEKKLALQEDELREAANADEFRLSGELLSAQLHLVKRGLKSVTVDNYYDPAGGHIEIALDETLNPAQNAQKYFKKYRKALAARKTAAEQKEKTLEEITLLETALMDLTNCETPDDLSDIRRTLEEAGIVKQERGRGRVKRPPESKPMEFVSSEGTLIFVGKNSVQNERLTKGARGDDLWLHAKNMPGSHVILRLDGKAPSQNDILEAAKLAAFYSKSRGVAVPVDYTYRKFVKKPAGTPPGFVIFTDNKTLLIDANEAEVRKLKKE